MFQASQPVSQPTRHLPPAPLYAPQATQTPRPVLPPPAARPLPPTQASAPYTPTQAPAPVAAARLPSSQPMPAPQSPAVRFLNQPALALAPEQTRPPTPAQIKVLNHFRSGNDLATVAAIVGVQRKTVETNMCKALEVLAENTLTPEDKARLVPQLTGSSLFYAYAAVIHRLRCGPPAALVTTPSQRPKPTAATQPVAGSQPLRAQAPAYIPQTQAPAPAPSIAPPRPQAPSPAPYIAPPRTQAAAPTPALSVAPAPLPIINPYSAPRKYELKALKAFRSGKTIAAIAKKAGIQPKTAEQYICKALECLNDDYLTREERQRLLPQLKDEFTLRHHWEIIGRMRASFAPPPLARAPLAPVSIVTQGQMNSAANTSAPASQAEGSGSNKRKIPWVANEYQLQRAREATHKSPSPSMRRAVNLFCAGHSFDQIAAAAGWKRSTVAGYITSALLYLPKKELNRANVIRLGQEIKGEYKGEVYRQCMKKVRAAHNISPLDSDDEEEPVQKKRRVEVAPAAIPATQRPSSQAQASSSQGWSASQGRSMAAPMTVEDLEAALGMPAIDADEARELEEEMRSLSQRC